MNDLVGMQVFYGQEQLGQVELCLRLKEQAYLPHPEVERTAVHEVHDQVQFFCVVEREAQLDDERMSHACQHCAFGVDALDIVHRHDVGFAHDLDGVDFAVIAFPHLRHTSRRKEKVGGRIKSESVNGLHVFCLHDLNRCA